MACSQPALYPAPVSGMALKLLWLHASSGAEEKWLIL
jgi:hypothetical protein